MLYKGFISALYEKNVFNCKVVTVMKEVCYNDVVWNYPITPIICFTVERFRHGIIYKVGNIFVGIFNLITFKNR